MDMKLLKKALPKGVLLGIALAFVYSVIRLLMNGGTFFSHLFSVYGILTMVCIPIAWVINRYNKEKESKK